MCDKKFNAIVCESQFVVAVIYRVIKKLNISDQAIEHIKYIRIGIATIICVMILYEIKKRLLEITARQFFMLVHEQLNLHSFSSRH